MADDVYRDSQERYARDVEFKMAVDVLFTSALAYGWTPGEIKQIAFLAAVKAEQYATKTFELPRPPRQCLRCYGRGLINVAIGDRIEELGCPTCNGKGLIL